MFIRSQRFPISGGLILDVVRSELSGIWGANGLTVTRKRPEAMTRRVVTVRDDSGTTVGRVQPRRQGVNVWADDPVDAIQIALDVLSIAEKDLPNGTLISGTHDFVGPYEIDDDTTIEVDGKILTHYFVSFVADVKAVAV